MNNRAEVVIGVDMGTTSTVSVAYDIDGRAVASQAVAYPLRRPHPGYAEQDPQEILTPWSRPSRASLPGGGKVRAVSFSSAMHTLIGLDRHGSPLTPS